MSERIVITGIGVVTSIGIGRERFWDNLLAGRSGISRVESFDTTGYGVSRGAEIKEFEPGPYIFTLSPSRIGRASQFAIAAARLALADGLVDLDRIPRERVGVVIGTTSGEPRVIEQFDDHYLADDLQNVNSDFIWSYPCHVIAEHIACEFDLAGINLTIPAACAAGNYAISHAFDALRSGRADLMIAGGSDCFSRITYAGFARLGAIASEVCRPFDRNREGMIPGEGAGILVLERLDQAMARGAPVYAEIAGYGLSCDAHHMTAAHPAGDGPARAMERALDASKTRIDQVDYISAHGTGTPTNDRIETLAVKRVFKDLAYSTTMSSIKSMLGHTMGAASAIETAVCGLAVACDVIPPTINLEDPDPECDLDYVPNSAREHRVDVAMNNAYAFGGNNASLVLKKCVA